MESQHKSSSQCSNIFPKDFWLFPFLSMLLTIALFLRMEAINNKTEINGMRISKVESQMKIMTTLHATDDKDVGLTQGRHVSSKKQWSFGHIALNQAKISATERNKLVRGSWPMHHGHSVTILLAIKLLKVSHIFRQILLCNKLAFMKRVRKILTRANKRQKIRERMQSSGASVDTTYWPLK